MANDSLGFYIKKIELSNILDELNRNFKIVYVKTGLFDTPEIEPLESPITPSYLNQNINGDWVHNDRFLILPKDSKLVVREIEQKKGGIKYAVDGFKNPESLLIVLGGEYDKDTIIAGEINANIQSDFTNEVLHSFKDKLKSMTKKIKGWYVSNNLEGHTRLTTNVKSPAAYNLKLS